MPTTRRNKEQFFLTTLGYKFYEDPVDTEQYKDFEDGNEGSDEDDVNNEEGEAERLNPYYDTTREKQTER